MPHLTFPTSSKQQPLKLSTHRSHLTSPCCRYPSSVAVLTSPSFLIARIGPASSFVSAPVIPSPSRRCVSPVLVIHWGWGSGDPHITLTLQNLKILCTGPARS
ncbi:hypothetical protein PIB30_017364 [Stylosanthes scabra]|uniref:Uncharacterized protein n=1 Tax=Stylosanthes scabra TaxID=79078 RepID=A0ABU6U8K4_9FABA|nr:hypothetical protein [Stylosanthes scabra]